MIANEIHEMFYTKLTLFKIIYIIKFKKIYTYTLNLRRH